MLLKAIAVLLKRCINGQFCLRHLLPVVDCINSCCNICEVLQENLKSMYLYSLICGNSLEYSSNAMHKSLKVLQILIEILNYCFEYLKRKSTKPSSAAPTPHQQKQRLFHSASLTTSCMHASSICTL